MRGVNANDVYRCKLSPGKLGWALLVHSLPRCLVTILKGYGYTLINQNILLKVIIDCHKNAPK